MIDRRYYVCSCRNNITCIPCPPKIASVICEMEVIDSKHKTVHTVNKAIESSETFTQNEITLYFIVSSYDRIERRINYSAYREDYACLHWNTASFCDHSSEPYLFTAWSTKSNSVKQQRRNQVNCRQRQVISEHCL